VAAAEERGVAYREIEGEWPDVAPEAPAADVVVSHHVAYNVGKVAAFVAALTDHARRLVVVELTGRHPASALNPLWERFWGLERPEVPTAATFVQVLREEGLAPVVQRWDRPARLGRADRAVYVAFVRRRLCLPAWRDPEVDAALGYGAPPEGVLTVSWSASPAW